MRINKVIKIRIEELKMERASLFTFYNSTISKRKVTNVILEIDRAIEFLSNKLGTN